MKSSKGPISIQALYDGSEEIVRLDGIPMTVGPRGSLGLLAVGYRGLVAWRKAKQDFPKHAGRKEEKA